MEGGQDSQASGDADVGEVESVLWSVTEDKR